MDYTNPAFPAILDTVLQHHPINNLDNLIEDSLKLCFLYNPYAYVIDGQVIDNTPFRRNFMSTACRKGSDLRTFLTTTFKGKLPLSVGRRRGANTLIDVLESWLGIGKKDVKPVFFSSLSLDQNAKVLKLHEEGKLTLDSFFQIADGAIIRSELIDIHQFLLDEGLYVDSILSPSTYRDEVAGICRIINESTPNDGYGKALQSLAKQFYDLAGADLLNSENIRRSDCFRIVDRLRTDVARLEVSL